MKAIRQSNASRRTSEPRKQTQPRMTIGEINCAKLLQMRLRSVPNSLRVSRLETYSDPNRGFERMDWVPAIGALGIGALGGAVTGAIITQLMTNARDRRSQLIAHRKQQLEQFYGPLLAAHKE